MLRISAERFRRAGLLVMVMLGGVAGGRVHAADPSGWAVYASRFVTSDGRVSDTGAGGISHSEGQGTALLLAGRAGDQASFDVIWTWTRSRLAVRSDALLAWSWRPNATGGTAAHVPDLNNATDGDLLVAWALAEAWQRWHVAGYRDAALAISRAIRGTLLRRTAVGPVLLPAARGFETADGVIINPSYAVLPALRALDRIDPDPVWRSLAEASHALLAVARFGAFSLPPDWLFIPRQWQPGGAGPVPAPWSGKPALFGYDAIRVPLYLAWDGADGRELWPFLQLWSHFDSRSYQPAWTDLQTGDVAPYPASMGAKNVRRLVAAAQAGGMGEAPGSVAGDTDYFSASLTMLSTLAWSDRGFPVAVERLTPP